MDRRARGPNKRAGEKGHNRPGSDSTPFEGLRVKRYLDALKETGLPIVARERANVTYGTVRSKRERDEEFAQAERDAQESHDASVEQEIHRRGFGYERKIWHEGRIVATEIVYSDRLLELYAKRRIKAYTPKVEVDQNSNHTGAVAVGAVDLTKLDAVGRAALRTFIQTAQGSKVEPEPKVEEQTDAAE